MRATARGGHRGQRYAVVLALFLVLTSFVVLPITTPPSARALADTHSCGTNNANRASLHTYHGNILVTPCISNVTLNMDIPLGPYGFGSYPYCTLGCYQRRFKVDEIRRIGQESVKMSDGTTQSLWHFSFAKFTANNAMTLSTTNGNGYTLSIVPDAFAQLGGANDAGVTMYTDLWITDGQFGVAGFCSIPVSASSGLIALVNGGNIDGCQLDLNIKYLVTYNQTVGSTGQYPLRLPLTTFTVS